MFKKERTNAREQLDTTFKLFKEHVSLDYPANGWIKAIRYALGMTSKQLGRKISISANSVIEMEKSEMNDTIQLKTLRKAAEALDCRLVYSLVPNQPLDQKFNLKAQTIARKRMARTKHSMSLEDQGVDNLREDIEVAWYINQHLKESDLWEE